MCMYTLCMIQVKVLYFVIYNSTDIKPIELRDVLPKPDVIPGRVGRRTKRQMSGQTQTSVEGRSQWMFGICLNLIVPI